MTTKLEKQSVLAVQEWCKKEKIKLISKPRHIHPRTYVVGYAASSCLIVARCWADSESQTKEWDKKYPLDVIRKFDHSLKAGDWCITAYVSTVGYGETIAIPLKEKNT